MSDGIRARAGMNLDKRKLRLILGLFLLALVIPTAVVIYQAYGQLRWETFYQHRLLAEEIADRIDGRLRSIIAVEEARSLADYGFLVIQGEPTANFKQRSPLANLPDESAIPGLMAYFQIDNRGTFTTPLLPVDADASAYGVTPQDIEQRKRIEQSVRSLLVAADAEPKAAAIETLERDKDLRFGFPAKRSVADTATNQAVFDRLDAPSGGKSNEAPAAVGGVLGKIADLKLDARLAAKSPDRQLVPSDEIANLERSSRKERAVLTPSQAEAPNGDSVRIFESELDPFVFRRLDAGHFVLFRKVWLNGERLIQGAVIAQDSFIEGIVGAAFRDTALSHTSNLIVGYRGDVVGKYSDRSATVDTGELLYRTALSAPLNDFELIFSVTQLPLGPGGRVIGWATLVLGLVLCGGFWVVYRFGVGQIDLGLQQRDFVSAVSHELKTPLTSIRMYGEILRAGWADEEKKRSYYDFIYHESERLSRLINNVLRLARLTRNGSDLDQKPVAAVALLSLVESKVAAQVEQAGFTLRLDKGAVSDDVQVLVDTDSVVQILINLVDNALKFSARADVKVVELGVATQRREVRFWVRDHGPGVPNAQMKKIFQLFYRAEGELTRETVGTGIGLALVQELTTAMGGTVQVRNRDPGAEFSIVFPMVVA